MAAVLDQSLSIPPDCRGVVITEGYTDGEFIRAACAVAGRTELVTGLHFIPAGGAKRMIIQAVLAQSATQLPVVALLDFDDNGRAAQSQLENFGWKKNLEILNLNNWPERCAKNHPVEIEDLISERVAEKIISLLGESNAVTAKRKCSDGWHYEFSEAWKQRALLDLSGLMRAEDTAGLIWAAEALNVRLDKVSQAKASRSARTGSKSKG